MANPFPLEFEELLHHFAVTGGQCTVYEGPAPAPFPDVTPTPISSIRTDQSWGVAVEWTTTGPLNHLMHGDWELICYLEQMGVGEFALPGNTNIVSFVPAPNPYSHVFSFGPGTVPAGAYRIVLTVTMMGHSGYRGPIAAIGEGPVIQFYQVGP